MLESLYYEIIVAIIMTVGSKILLMIWNAIKSISRKKRVEKEQYTKRQLRIEFYIGFFSGIICLALLLTQTEFQKALCFLLGTFSFFIMWSAFGVSLDQWNDCNVNKSVDNKPNNKSN